MQNHGKNFVLCRTELVYYRTRRTSKILIRAAGGYEYSVFKIKKMLTINLAFLKILKMKYPQTYNWVMKVLHWGMALAFVGMYVVAYIMRDMPKSPEKYQLYGMHKSMGLTLLALVLVRFAYRTFHGVPAISSSLSPLCRLAAALGHYALYAVMLLMPLTGYLMGSKNISYFGLFEVPVFNHSLGRFFHESHMVLSYIIYALVGAHVVMALVHHFILKDDTLVRMVPGMKVQI